MSYYSGMHFRSGCVKVSGIVQLGSLVDDISTFHTDKFANSGGHKEHYTLVVLVVKELEVTKLHNDKKTE